MERPAHTAPFQPIWNHPAEENGQNVNLGSTGDNLGQKIILGGGSIFFFFSLGMTQWFH
jgi:hypothetical protein